MKTRQRNFKVVRKKVISRESRLEDDRRIIVMEYTKEEDIRLA